MSCATPRFPHLAAPLTMVRPYISDARVGDGYRTAFVVRERGDAALLFVPSRLATVTMPKAAVEKAQRIAYRPRRVRENMLALARTYRRIGHRFPKAATVAVLRSLGAARAAADEAISIEASPETIAARARRAVRAELAPEVAAVAAAIRAKIDLQLAEAPTRDPERPARRRRRETRAHPDQLALAF